MAAPPPKGRGSGGSMTSLLVPLALVVMGVMLSVVAVVYKRAYRTMTDEQSGESANEHTHTTPTPAAVFSPSFKRKEEDYVRDQAGDVMISTL